MNNLWDLTSGISFHECIVKLLKFVKSICFKQCCQVCCILPQHKNKLARFSSTFFLLYFSYSKCALYRGNMHITWNLSSPDSHVFLFPSLSFDGHRLQVDACTVTEGKKSRVGNQTGFIVRLWMEHEWHMYWEPEVSTQLERKPVWMRRLCFTCVFSAVTCGPFMEITTCFHVPLEKRISVVSINRVFDWLCARHSLCIHPVVNI